jgi:hypothetical protein
LIFSSQYLFKTGKVGDSTGKYWGKRKNTETIWKTGKIRRLLVKKEKRETTGNKGNIWKLLGKKER